MVPDLTRRSALRAGVVPVGALLAGCGGGDGDASPPDPDEGRDSYGIALFSEADGPVAVEIEAGYAWADETVFDETVEIEPGERREWDGVITDEREHVVVARIDDGEQNHEYSNVWVTPGSENEPTDADVQVRVSTVTVQREGGAVDVPAVGVYFESERAND